MKNKIKLFGIITLAVIISFITTGCPKDEDEDHVDTVQTVTSVTISPAAASVAKGGTQQFTATVTGTNNPAQTVTWSIVQTNKNAGTTINASGLLTIAAAETLTSLTVKAASTVDTTKSGTAAVTISASAAVTSVTISPAAASVAKGGTQQFNATVTGTNNPAQTVTWSIVQTNKNAGTTINASGLLTVAVSETLTSLTVKAASTVDTTKSGTAAVTISAPADSTSSLTSVSNASEMLGSYDSRQNVMKIDVSKLNDNWAVAQYSLSAYKNKEITITLSVDVKREGAAGTLNWQVNNNPGYPSVAALNNAANNTWHTMTGTLTVTPSDANPALYLNNDKTAGTTNYYIDNLSVIIVETSAGGGEPSDFTGFTGETLNSSSKEQETRKVNGYDYELWNQDKRGTAVMTLGNGGGGTYKCSWSGINNALFRAGRKYNEQQTHSQIGIISVEYTANKFEITGGDVTYLSVYGWVTNGTSTTSDNLVEYYIVDNYGSYNPGSNGTNKGTVQIDGATYTLYEKTINGPSIKGGITTFTQYLSVRAAGSKRLSGTISVSEHFNAWNSAGMTKINGKMYEVALKVEAYSGSPYPAAGSAEITKNILKINGIPIQ